MARVLTEKSIRKQSRSRSSAVSSDQEDFYRELRGSEAALLFGSSFEQDGADELEIPLIRMDYPVFDEVCLTPRPHLGGQGTLHLLEDIFRGIMNGRTLKGALYQ